MIDKINFRGVEILNKGKDVNYLFSLPEHVVTAVEKMNLYSLEGGMLGAGKKEGIAFAVINEQFDHGRNVGKNGNLGLLCADVVQTNNYPKPKYRVAFMEADERNGFEKGVICNTRVEAIELVTALIGAKDGAELKKRVAVLKAKKAEDASER